MAAVLIIPFLFVAALPVILPVLGGWTICHKRSLAIPEISLYWLCGCAFWLAEIHRKDIFHLVFGSPFLIMLCIYYLEQYRSKVADLALQVLLISSACLLTLNCLLVLSAHRVTTRVGSVAMFQNDPALTHLQNIAPRGDEIFMYASNPVYYFLSATTNPTRYSGLGYNYNSPSEFQEVVRVLDQHRVKYVVWGIPGGGKVFRAAFPSMKLPRLNELIMEPYLESHYRQVWAQDGVRIMERKSEDH